MALANLQRMLNNGGARQRQGPAPDQPLPDTSEKVQISSLSLLKMLKHGNCLNNKIFYYCILYSNSLKGELVFQWR